MSIYNNFKGHESKNYTDEMLPSMKLDKQDIPPIPFLWFRENHIRLEPYGLFKVDRKDFLKYVAQIKEEFKLPKKKILPEDKLLQECTIQLYYDLSKDIREVFNKSINHLYISLHSWIYRIIHPENKSEIIISSKYKHNDKAQVTLIPVDCVNLQEMKKSKNVLRFNEVCEGSVHTHDASFSPPGHFCINIDRKANNTSDELNKPNIFITQCSYKDKTSTCLMIMATNLKDLDDYIQKLKKIIK